MRHRSHRAPLLARRSARRRQIRSLWMIPPLAAVCLGWLIWLWLPRPALPPAIATASDTLQKPHPVAGPRPAPARRTTNSQVVGGSAPAAASAHPPASTARPAPPTMGTLVALGDSITFGYNLPGAAPGHPSQAAFPFLVAAEQHWRTVDLAVPGWTSTNLLHALQSGAWRAALRQANVITLDIGSNDLLETTYDLAAATGTDLPPADAVLEDPRYTAALREFAANLPAIVAAVREQSSAPLVLLTLYDPFPDGSSLHAIAEQVVAAANQVIVETAAANGLTVADVYTAFNHHQAADVRLEALDIHPTANGQRAIADAVHDALASPLWHHPVFYAIANHGTLVYSQPKRGPLAAAWVDAGHGMLVTGNSGDWLQVVAGGGIQGYVQRNAVTVTVRPVADAVWATYTARLSVGEATDAGTHQSAQVLFWNGTPYVPADFLAREAAGNAAYDASQHVWNLETPEHSGLIQTGLLGGAPTAQGQPPIVQVAVTGAAQTQSFRTAGVEVTIDGEPVVLPSPPIFVQSTLYLPLTELWTALGGGVTRDTRGLLRLSAGGS